MTEPEIRVWLEALAPSDKGRITKLKELLHHATGDGMSKEDKLVCKQELKRLEASVLGRGER